MTARRPLSRPGVYPARHPDDARGEILPPARREHCNCPVDGYALDCHRADHRANAAELEEQPDDWGPTPGQEEAWDAREDYARGGHA